MAEMTTGERDVLRDYLDHYRDELVKSCDGLTLDQLASRPIPSSTLSLLGLVRHLAKVEHYWTRMVMEGEPGPRLYAEAKDADFDQAVATQECVDEAWSSWRREVAHAQEHYESCADLASLGQHHDEPLEYRDLVVHLIEEYARHLGHADLLREAIDGKRAS